MKIGVFKRTALCMKKAEGTKTTIMMRIVRLAIISVICATGIMAFFAINSMTNVLKKNYESQVENSAKIYGDTVNQWTNLIKNQIANEASKSEFVDTTKSIAERKALLEEAALETEFTDLSISDAKGKTYNDTDISAREYFLNSVNGGTYISSPVVRKTDGSTVIMVGSKLKTKGYDGIIYGGINIDFFSELLANIEIGDNAQGFIVDSNGALVAATDSSLVTQLAAKEANLFMRAEGDKTFDGTIKVVKKMCAGETGHSTVKFIDGKKYIIGYRPLGNAEGWSIAIMIESKEATASVKKIFRECIVLVLVIVLVEIFSITFIAGGIAFPVRQATEELKKIADGDLEGQTDDLMIRADETGALLNSVKTTKEELNSYINEIGNVVEGIADGNLNQAITREYKGDFVKIKNSLNMIIDTLNNTFMNAGNASLNLLEGSRQVEMASQALASASTEQASAVVEITSSIEGISKSVADNTDNVVKVNNLTRAAKEEADNGNEEMHHMIAAMDDINNSSQSIAKIMKVIDDIAFQTNILALNASVEAARAGVHGKGFAVVAEEVRALAGKSSDAAGEIDDMIDDTLKKISTGSDIAAKTAKKLEQIVQDIDEIADTMEEIAAMSKEQAVAIDQVNTGIEQISSAVQNNSATSEECAASSVELTEQAEGMLKQIRYYKLR